MEMGDGEMLQKMKSGFLSKLFSIRVKLFVGLLIPAVLLGIYGFYSYGKSKTALVQSYEKNSAGTLNTLRDYLNYGMTTIENKSEELISNSDIRVYYNKKNNDDFLSALNQQDAIQTDIKLAKDTNSFIAGIHLLGANGKGISTVLDLSDTLYQAFMDSPEAIAFQDSKLKSIWVGSHSNLDQALVKGEEIYNSDHYAMSYIRKMSSDKGFVIIDVSTPRVLDMLSKYDMGKGSVLGLVNSNGYEVLTGTDEKRVFSNLSYYHNAAGSQEASGYYYENYRKKEYLFLYSKLEGTDVMVCALIPQSTILSQVSGIRSVSIVFVTASCIFAVLMAIFIAGGVSSAIGSLMKSISLASKGDLTAIFDTKRKDEFLALTTGASDMIKSMRKLIGEVQEVGKVNTSAGGLSDTSEELLTATKGISKTIDDIEQGIVQQAEDTEQCLHQMSGLSDQIGNVYGSTSEMEKIAGNTKDIAGEGIVIIDELGRKSKDTADITQNVIHKIEEFEVQSKKISEIINVINDIASQTNLLSLNASIEAARAGEAGRGFAVVAGEIRKLADQSVQSISQIEDIVHEINAKTKDTVNTAKQAESIVESQTEALNKTVVTFNNINDHVNDLVSNLASISSGIKNIEKAKEDTLEAIENISSVSEETAAASEEVNATALNQIDSVERLRQEAMELANNANILEEAIRIFKI